MPTPGLTSPSDLLSRFGQSVREQRINNKRWTISKLASEAGVSKRSIEAYEAGITDPSLARAVRIADLFGLTMDQMIGRAAPPSVRISIEPPTRIRAEIADGNVITYEPVS